MLSGIEPVAARTASSQHHHHSACPSRSALCRLRVSNSWGLAHIPGPAHGGTRFPGHDTLCSGPRFPWPSSARGQGLFPHLGHCGQCWPIFQSFGTTVSVPSCAATGGDGVRPTGLRLEDPRLQPGCSVCMALFPVLGQPLHRPLLPRWRLWTQGGAPLRTGADGREDWSHWVPVSWLKPPPTGRGQAPPRSWSSLQPALPVEGFLVTGAFEAQEALWGQAGHCRALQAPAGAGQRPQASRPHLPRVRFLSSLPGSAPRVLPRRSPSAQLCFSDTLAG